MAKLYRITAMVTHHTNDDDCKSISVSLQVPSFVVDAVDKNHAIEIAKKIICPVELQYESLSMDIDAVQLGK